MDIINPDYMLTAARIYEEVQARRIGEGMTESELRAMINSVLSHHSSTSTTSSSCSHSSIPSPLDSHRSPSSTQSSTPTSFSPRRKTGKVTKHSRVAHNELEKTRRANLRSCLERLKELVPPVGDNAARNTTLALLTRGRDHLKELDGRLSELEFMKDAAEQRRKELRESLESLLHSSTPSTSNSSSIISSNPSTCPPSPCSFECSPSSSKSMESAFDLISFFKSSLPSIPPSPPSYKIDPVLDGLVAITPICYPRPAIPSYTYDDLLRVHCPQLSLTSH